MSKKTKNLVGRRYKRRSDLKKERFRRLIKRTKQASKEWRRSAFQWAIISTSGVALCAFLLLLFSPLLHLQEIKIRRLNPRLDIEQVQQVLSPLFGRHLFFLAGSEVREILYENISDIDTVELKKEYPSQLIVTVGLHPLVARLNIIDPNTEGEIEVGSGSGMDFLTEKGVYIATAVQQEVEELKTIRLVDWGVRPSPGIHLVPPEILVRLQETEEALQVQFGHAIEMQTIYLRAQEYHLIADDISLWFDMKSSLEQHLQRYRIFMQSVPRNDVRQYIDLRLTDRIAYQ